MAKLKQYIRKEKDGCRTKINWTSYLEISSNIKRDGGCGVDHIKDRKVKAESHHSRSENDN